MRTPHVMATNTPIREKPAGTYTCQRCGIQPQLGKSKGTYCIDCRPYMKGLR
jgi:hypothetical protein